MKPSSVTLIALISLGLGAAVGWIGAGQHYTAWLEEYRAAEAVASLNSCHDALKALRGGNAGICGEALESRLDGQVMVLGDVLRNRPAESRLPGHLHLLERLREYRAAHPRKTASPRVDAAVAEVFTTLAPGR
jgi:hypothetical protein